MPAYYAFLLILPLVLSACQPRERAADAGEELPAPDEPSRVEAAPLQPDTGRPIPAEGAAPAREPLSALLYGDGYAYWLNAPAGWVVDNRAGVSMGLQVVFYPEGETWQDSPAVIYSSKYTKQEGQDLQAIIAQDLEKTQRNSPTAEIREAPPIATAAAGAAKVFSVRGDRWGNYDAVAFIDQPTIVVTVVLHTRGEEQFDAHFDAFASVVRSYAPMERLDQGLVRSGSPGSACDASPGAEAYT